MNEMRTSVEERALRLQLHGAIYRPDSFVMMLRYCANLKAIRYESTSLNRIVADKSHRVNVNLTFPGQGRHDFFHANLQLKISTWTLTKEV